MTRPSGRKVSMNGVELGRSLFEEIDQAVRVEPVADPDWHGLPGKCHENVERWVALHPTDRPVRGYLVSSPSKIGAVFDLHSVVQRRDGSLVEVTPLAYQCTFIRHEMSDNQF
jgi:hypothetical protein